MQLQNMKNNFKKEQRRITILFLFVPILLICLFVLLPVVLMIFYSFTNWNGYSAHYDFIGFENYRNLLEPENMKVLKVVIYYLVSSVIQLIIGIYLAIYIYFKKRFKILFIIIILLPVLINTVAVGLIFRLVLMPGGMFDMLLDKFHIINFINENESIKWIGDSKIVNYTLSFISLWRYTPFTFILIYGALLSVDEKLVKAAVQMGANKWYISRYVLLPNIKTTLIIVCTTLAIGAISTIELPMVMTNGTLGTKTIVMRIQEVAFSMRNFGMASVISLFVLSIIILIIIIRFMLGVSDET